MVVVRRQHIEWHDPSCSSQHVVKTSTFVACLSCGSSGPPPPATLPPLPSESSIRLLWLLPGGKGDPIECYIRVQSLSSGPLFSAISYTWADDNGDDSNCEEVILDGQPVHVSRNCYAALKRVRKAATTSIIWIDAVCIDQNHAEERGHQVKLMPQIYLQAQTVFVYVGEHHSGSRDLCDTIWQISLAQDPDHFTKLLVRVSNSAWHSFLARKYFSRLWILQELALAKRAIVLCGDSSLAWDHFANYSRLMDQRYGTQQHSIFMFQRSLYLSVNQELFLLDHGRRAHARDPRDKFTGY